MLDGSYVAVKTVGSKPYSKKHFFLYLHRTVQQTTLWLDYMESPHLQSVIKAKIFLFIGYTVTLWVLQKSSTCPHRVDIHVPLEHE